MRHLKKGRKLQRKRGQRQALLSTLATSLVRYGKIKTTEAKAKELRPFVERLVTYAKRQDIPGLRKIMKHLPKEASHKLYNEIAPRYVDRKGGYTRIVKLTGPRVRDGAEMATVEFV